jgi:fructose-specific component phosphotransferase system IIB-like protein
MPKLKQQLAANPDFAKLVIVAGHSILRDADNKKSLLYCQMVNARTFAITKRLTFANANCEFTASNEGLYN